MRAGKLRHMLTILDPVDMGTDNLGDVQVKYVSRPVPVAGSIEPLTGRELWIAQQARGDVTHKITLRGAQVITERHRISWNGRTWECGPPLNTEERNITLTITAVEIKEVPK